jgi:hypothetical protein
MAMRPGEIEEHIHSTNQQTISYTIPGTETADETVPKLADGEL